MQAKDILKKIKNELELSNYLLSQILNCPASTIWNLLHGSVVPSFDKMIF
jgi:predicted transcriptional regulator